MAPYLETTLAFSSHSVRQWASTIAGISACLCPCLSVHFSAFQGKREREIWYIFVSLVQRANHLPAWQEMTFQSRKNRAFLTPIFSTDFRINGCRGEEKHCWSIGGWFCFLFLLTYRLTVLLLFFFILLKEEHICLACSPISSLTPSFILGLLNECSSKMTAGNLQSFFLSTLNIVVVFLF